MNCPKCGAPVDPGAPFCPNCGVNLSAATVAAATPAQQPVTSIPKAYKPISPWGYLGFSILYAIPVIGFIFLLIFTFNKSNLNRRNYARSYWCAFLIVLILALIGAIIAAATGTMDEFLDIFRNYAASLGF